MKQVLQNIRTGETYVAEVPIPAPQPGEVLVRTAASLVSAGTERMVVEFAGKSLLGKARARPDLARQVLDKARREGLLTTVEAAFNKLDQPMALGYSSAGTIVALGEGVTGLKVGERLACAGGNYAVHAEYAAVPVNLVAPLPAGLPAERAAFATLGAIALHGFRLAETQLGERVAVIGLGLLGLLATGIARAAGCQVLGIDVNPQRVALAEQMGAVAVERPRAAEAAQSFSLGRGCDAVLICADTPSADPVELAGRIARDRARVVAVGAVGLSLPRKVYYEKELTFLNSRSYGPGRYDPSYEEGGLDYPIGYVRWSEGRNLQAVVELLADGRLDIAPLITHRFPIERAAEAYALITGKQSEPFLGVVLTYPEPPESEQAAPANRDLAQPSAKLVLAHPDSQPTVSQLLSVGVLGAGNFATAVLLPAMRKVPGVTLVGIASASGLSAQYAAKRFGFRYATSDEARLLADADINTIAILTRHGLHARQVLAALQAGKHVFCEKPLALTDTELEAIAAALKAAASKAASESASANKPAPLLTVGFNRRFAPLARRLQSFLAQGQEPLAAFYRVNAGYLPPNHWLHDPVQGGGRILGEACHFIDFLTFLAGSPPSAVIAHGLPNGGRYHEDNVTLTFTFPDGSIGTVAYLANGDKAFPKERVEVFRGGKVAVLDDFRSLQLVSDGRQQVLRARLRQDKGHLGEWQAWQAAIAQGAPAPIPYDHLFGVMQACFAAVQALHSGERVALEAPIWREND